MRQQLRCPFDVCQMRGRSRANLGGQAFRRQLVLGKTAKWRSQKGETKPRHPLPVHICEIAWSRLRGLTPHGSTLDHACDANMKNLESARRASRIRGMLKNPNTRS